MVPQDVFLFSDTIKGNIAFRNAELTMEQIEKTMQQCDYKQLKFIGGKISLSPNEANVDQRISYLKSLTTLLDHVLEIKS